MDREEIGRMLENHELWKKAEIARLKNKKKLTIFEAAQLACYQGNGGSMRGDKSGWATPANW